MFLSVNRFCCLIIIVLVFIVILFSLDGVTRSKPQELDILESYTEFQLSNPPQFKALDNDYKDKIFNLTIKYINSADSCNDDLLAVIMVTSYYGNVETRSSMRRAFSQKNLDKLHLKRVFLLGEAPSNSYVTQASIINENSRFKDIIQGNFTEAYRNLTYKHIMGLKWVSEHCYSAKYLVKMDDDIVINVEKVARMLKNISLPGNSIAGYVFRNMTPIREPANKWYVTEEEYSFSKYPSFVSGWFYITTPKIASKFFLLSHYFKYFWIDDVYVTGILSRNLRMKQFDLKRYFTVFPEFLQCCIADVEKNLDCDILIGPNGGDSNLFFKFNKAMEMCRLCNKRIKPINETCVAERKIHLQRGNAIIERYNLH